MAKGKLKALFKKKEGGSALGNALRFVGDKVTGGTYSSVFPKPTAQDIDKKGVITAANTDTSVVDAAAAAQAAADAVANKERNAKTMKIVAIAGAVLTAIIVIVKMMSNKKGGRK